SMDISKASNFERFVFDLTGRDPGRTRALFADVERRREFTLADAERARLPALGMVSGRSSGADRLATIRQVHEATGQVIDPHTADALKVARAHAGPGTPMVVLETALAAKFGATVRDAIGIEPPRPARFAGLEALPRRFVTMPVDVAALKAF